MFSGKDPFEHFDRTVRQMFDRISQPHQDMGIGPKSRGLKSSTEFVDQRIDENQEKLTVTIDILGVEKEDIDVRVKSIYNRDILVVQCTSSDGVRKRKFQKTVQLRTAVDEDLADARYNNGVLTIEFPIAQSDGNAGTQIDID